MGCIAPLSLILSSTPHRPAFSYSFVTHSVTGLTREDQWQVRWGNPEVRDGYRITWMWNPWVMTGGTDLSAVPDFAICQSVWEMYSAITFSIWCRKPGARELFPHLPEISFIIHIGRLYFYHIVLVCCCLAPKFKE